MEISKDLKLILFNLIKQQNKPFGEEDEQEGLIPFLNQIWDLKKLPSEDERFDEAESDIYQHTINNYDWDIDYLFINRLKILENDLIFFDFLNAILSPNNRKNEDEIIKFVAIFNPILDISGFQAKVFDYTILGLPIYKVTEKDNNDNSPIDLKENNIPFYIDANLSGRESYHSSHQTPPSFPSFVLAFNKGWNDYNIKSSFFCFYYGIDGICNSIGPVKIIHKTECSIINQVDNMFLELSDDYCSLGQTDDYYFKLKSYFDVGFESVLFALRDCAYFPDNHERFEKMQNFNKSLIRSDAAERRVREIKHKLQGYDLSNLYNFNYSFLPIFSTDSIDIDFGFNSNKDIPNRIYAIIGKNGSGKTQLITSLPLKISKKNKEYFSPRLPLFSKVIAVSYSNFDTFEIPRKTSSFNYVYCGLRSEKGDILSSQALILRFHRTWKKIQSLERINQWREVLMNFIDEDIIDIFILPEEEQTPNNKNSFTVSIEGFNKVKNMLSSGQNIVLYIITEIVAHIRYDSLLLYDEPETHLHPNAITQLVNTIYDLVNKFESYCIIATHSPLIISELFSKNVYILKREGNTPSIHKIGIESFGENISTLTEEVFGNKDIPRQYKKIIKKLVASGKSYEEIIALLKFDQIPVGLNARLFIKSLTNN